jgi:hypothetical protein
MNGGNVVNQDLRDLIMDNRFTVSVKIELFTEFTYGEDPRTNACEVSSRPDAGFCCEKQGQYSLG